MPASRSTARRSRPAFSGKRVVFALLVSVVTVAALLAWVMSGLVRRTMRSAATRPAPAVATRPTPFSAPQSASQASAPRILQNR